MKTLRRGVTSFPVRSVSRVSIVRTLPREIRVSKRFISDQPKNPKSASPKATVGASGKEQSNKQVPDLKKDKQSTTKKTEEPKSEEEALLEGEEEDYEKWLEQIQGQGEGVRFAGGPGEVLMDTPLLWDPLPPPPPTLFNIHRVTTEAITASLKYRHDWELQLFKHFYERPLRDRYAAVLKQRVEEAAREKNLQRKQYVKRAKRDALKKIRQADFAEMKQFEDIDIQRDSQVERVSIEDILDTLENTNWNEELDRYDAVDSPVYMASRRGWDNFTKQQDSDDQTLMHYIQQELKDFGFQTIPLEQVVQKIPTRTKKTRLGDEYPFMMISKHWASESHAAWNLPFLQRKVKLKIKVSALKLSPAARERLISICGLRYNADTDLLSLVGDVHPHQSWNKNYVRRLLQALLSEAWKADEKYVPPEGIPPPNTKIDFTKAVAPNALLSLYHLPLPCEL